MFSDQKLADLILAGILSLNLFYSSCAETGAAKREAVPASSGSRLNNCCVQINDSKSVSAIRTKDTESISVKALLVTSSKI